MGEWVNSMCSVWAELIEYQLRSSNPDMEAVHSHLESIKENCHLVSNPPGETPEALEEYLFENGEGAGKTGLVVVDGDEIPSSAAEKLQRD